MESFAYLLLSPSNAIFFIVKQVADASASLLIIFELFLENLEPLDLGIYVFVGIVHDLSQSWKLLIILAADFFLFIDKLFVIINFLPDIKIDAVFISWDISHLVQLHAGMHDIFISYSESFKQSNLFILGLLILQSEWIQFANEHVELLPILSNLRETLTLKLLLFKLKTIQFLLQMFELFLQFGVVSLSWSKLVDLCSQFIDEVVLVRTYWCIGE